MTRRLSERALNTGAEGSTLKTQGGVAQWITELGGIAIQEDDTTVASNVDQLDFRGSGVSVSTGTDDVIISIDGGGGNLGYSATASTLMSRSTIQPILGSTWTAVVWDAVSEDFFGGHSNTVNPSRWVCASAGLFTFSTTITSTTGNFFFIQYAINGTRVGGRVSSAGEGAPSGTELTRTFRLNQSDYVEVFVYSPENFSLAGRDTYTGQEDFCTWAITSSGVTLSGTDQTAARTVRFTDTVASGTISGSTQVPGLSLTNVTGGRTVLVSAGITQANTHLNRYSIWVDGVKQFPNPATDELGMMTSPDSGNARYQLFISAVPIVLAPGAHTIEVRFTAQGSTASVNFYDRYLVVEDSSGIGNIIDAEMSNYSSSKTDGNVTLNSTTFTDIDSDLDLVVPASPGDFIEVELQARTSAATATYVVLDFQTIVAGSPVHSVSTGTTAGTTLTGGVPNWESRSVQTSAAGYSNLSGNKLYQVQTTDIESGSVRLRLRGYSGDNVVISASDPSLYVQAKNLRVEGGGISTGVFLMESGGAVPPNLPVGTIVYEKL